MKVRERTGGERKRVRERWNREGAERDRKRKSLKGRE